MDEFNKIPLKSDESVPELHDNPANNNGCEFHDAEELNETANYTTNIEKSKTKTQSSNISGLITKVIIAVSAGIAGIGILSVLPAITNEVKGTINSLNVTTTSVYYDVSFSNNDGKDVIAQIKNNFIKHQQVVNTNTFDGLFENLKPNMTYTFSLICNNTTIIEKQVKTSSIKDAETKFYEDQFKYECKCNIDGFFYFKMKVQDDFDYWSDYYATLKDKYGDIASLSFTNPNVEQKLDVDSNNLKGTTATLTITCKSLDASDSTVQNGIKKLLEKEVNI